MLTYVIRRLLYSVVVLIAASFIIFTFVSVSGDPLAFLRMQPTASEITIQNIEERKHLDDPIPVRYVYWVQGRAHEPVRDDDDRRTGRSCPTSRASWGTRSSSSSIAELLAILIAVGIGVYSALRQYSVFDYTATTFSFVGLATPVFWLALMLQVLFVNIYQWTGVRIFSDREPERRRPGTGLHFVLDRAQHLALPVHRAHGREHRLLLALHARVDARGRQLRLRPHRAREGPAGAERDDAARLPERAHPARHASSRSTSGRCSAARSSPRPSSRSTAWASTSSTR